MANINLTAEAVKAVARRIKLISPDLKHTAIIEEIAAAFGWKADALMHALKVEAEKDRIDPGEGQEIDFLKLKEFVDRHIPGGNQGEFVDDELVDIWIRMKQYVRSKNRKDPVLITQTERWVIENGDPVHKVPKEVVEQTRRTYLELKERLKAMAPIDEDRIAAFLGEKRDCTLQPKDSIKEDCLVCLLDGQKKKMLKRYLWARYQLTAEAYRALFQLPGDYPMVALTYADEKRAIARAHGITKKDDPEN